MQIMAMDIMGPFPETKQGSCYVLVISDYFTRWVEAYGIPNQEATTVARKLVDEMFCRFGIPEQLHSDMGAQFESKLIHEICKLLQIHKTHTTPYHPQSDGLVERLNRTIQSMLATIVDESGGEWEEHLSKVCFAYNTSKQSSTGFTPFQLMFGRLARIPLDVIYKTPMPEPTTVPQYVAQLRQSLEKAYKLTRENLKTAAGRQKERYDRKRHGDPYKVGDKVWLHSTVIPRGRAKKLHCPWSGPFTVIKCISDAVYRVQDSRARRRRQVVHFDRLKPCNPNMRAQENNQPASGPSPTMTQQRSQSTSSTSSTLVAKDSTTPPGTNLQLVEDDDTDTQQAPEASDVSPTTEQPRRYPLRTSRRRPARYADGYQS